LYKTISGAELPPGWLGKNWACHQLGQKASGDIFLFLDADVLPETDLIQKVKSEFILKKLDFLSIWPNQHMSGIWQKAVIPMMYFTLLSLLPEKYVEQEPRWIPEPFRSKNRHLFSAACGQAVAFTREAYSIVGGHQSVKAEVVEDVQLARKIKQNGLKMAMFNGLESISCKMYSDNASMFEGFRKNFFAGFDHNLLLFLFMGLVQILVLIVPIVLFVWSWVSGGKEFSILASLILILFLISRIAIHKLMLWPYSWIPLHALAVLWYWRLAFTCIADHFLGRSAKWKGRELRH
jgi:chlorobactene glucosyltransferase